MNPDPRISLEILDRLMQSPSRPAEAEAHARFYTGVDLGTATLVLVVLDEQLQPVAGAYRYAQVARDGLVVDYIGAVDLLKELKAEVEEQLGFPLEEAASGYPPGVPKAEVRATANVLEAAGLHCVGLADEPSAANYVLGLQSGAIVDVGGGTTGIAVVEDGRVAYTADEPTGGVHFSLTVAGALDLPYEQAEVLKRTPAEQPRLLPVVRPVMEKVAAITRRHIAAYPVQQVVMVGGSSQFQGMDAVVSQALGLPVTVPQHAMLVTPLGIALHHAAVSRGTV